MFINVEMPTIIGILTFIGMITTSSEFESFSSILVFMSRWNFVLSWVEHEKNYKLGARILDQYIVVSTVSL